ncbi:MAG: hypothetical protein E7174_01400 [Firmicutes bacterium]|nr:hypothetical protein [Bacillota bacterium]
MKKKVLNISLILLINLIFIDIVGAETYNNYTKGITSCGGNMVDKIPTVLPNVISILYNVIQIAVPIVLVVMGSMDLMKSLTAGKEDEMKKGQQLFIKRLVYAVLIFFVFIIVKFLISFVANDESNDNKAVRIMQCADCFITKNCDTKW